MIHGMTLGITVRGDGDGADLGTTVPGDGTILGIILAGVGDGTDLGTEADGTEIITITIILGRHIIAVQDVQEDHIMDPDTLPEGVMRQTAVEDIRHLIRDRLHVLVIVEQIRQDLIVVLVITDQVRQGRAHALTTMVQVRPRQDRQRDQVITDQQVQPVLVIMDQLQLVRRQGLTTTDHRPVQQGQVIMDRAVVLQGHRQDQAIADQAQVAALQGQATVVPVLAVAHPDQVIAVHPAAPVLVPAVRPAARDQAIADQAQVAAVLHLDQATVGRPAAAHLPVQDPAAATVVLPPVLQEARLLIVREVLQAAVHHQVVAEAVAEVVADAADKS